MERFTFLLFDVLFLLVPVILTCTIWRKQAKKAKKLILYAMGVGVIFDLIVDPVGASWKAWNYDYTKSLGSTIGMGTIETLMWSISLMYCLALLVSIFAAKEEKKKAFFS